MVGLPLAGAIGVLGVGLGSLAEAAALPRRQSVLPGSGTSTSWQSFIRTPSRPRITPQRVVDGSVVGNVTNPTGFITGNGPTVLSRGTSDPNPPCLTVDFGQNYAGLLGIDFGGSVQDSSSTASQRPGLTLAFSETMQFLTSTSDFTRSQNAGANVRLSFPGRLLSWQKVNMLRCRPLCLTASTMCVVPPAYKMYIHFSGLARPTDAVLPCRFR